MKRLFSLILCAMALIFSLNGCRQKAKDEPVIAPAESKQPLLSESPSPTQSPSLSPSPSPSPEMISYKIEDFFPDDNIYVQFVLRPDDKNEECYVEYRSKSGSSEITQHRVIGTNGKPRVEIFRFDGESISLVQTLNDIGYTYNMLDRAPKEGEILLIEPIVPGTSWSVSDGNSTITSIDRFVSLPIGHVNTVEVQTNYDDGTKRRQLFMTDLGLVAEYFHDADGNLVSSKEASLYEREKEFSQSVRFYYADQIDNSIKYVTRRLSIKTDQNLADLICANLKKRPADTFIKMSDSVKIYSIKLDRGYVHVNFSSALVDKMDMSRQNERAFLQAITNTLGAYYQAQRVYINVEGDNYSSRYIVLMDGEYFTPQTRDIPRFEQ